MKKLNKIVFISPFAVAIPLIAAVACSPADSKFKVESPTVVSQTPESTVLKVKITNQPKEAKVSEFSLTIQEKGKTTENTKKTVKGDKSLEGEFISFNFGALTNGTEYQVVEVVYKKGETEVKVASPTLEFKVQAASATGGTTAAAKA